MQDMIRVAVDAMGGDNAPDEKGIRWNRLMYW